MGVVIRQSVKSSIVSLTGALIAVLINYLYTLRLPKAEVGSIQFLLRLGAVLQFVILLGAGPVLFTYIGKIQDVAKRKALISVSMLVPAAAILILTIPYVILREQIILLFLPEDRAFISNFFYLIPPFALFWSYMTLFESYLWSQVKVALPTFIKEVVFRVINLGLLALLWVNAISFNEFIFYLIFSHLLLAVCLLYIAVKTEAFGFSGNWKIFSLAEYKDMGSFAWYHLLSGISLYLLGYLDTFFLGLWKGFAPLAVYAMAVQIVTFMIIPYRVMATATMPVLNESLVNNDRAKLENVFHRSGINIFIVAVGLFVLIACNLHNAVAILPPQYEAVTPICLILMLGRLIDMATGLNSEVIGLSHLYKFNFRISIVLLICLVAFNYLLVPEYGIYGAAWGATLSLAVFNILKFFYLSKRMDLHPFSKNTVSVLLIGIVSASVGYFLPVIPSASESFLHHLLLVFADVAVRSMLIVLVFVLMTYKLKPSGDFNQYMDNLIRSKRLF